VQDAVGVGEERIAAFADEQPAGAGLDGRSGGVEADRGVLDELSPPGSRVWASLPVA
jgi:hypothetical protein